MTNEKFNQANQANNQKIAEAAEAKTVLNGKTIPLKQAQAAEEAAAQQNMQTGIQSHHDNSTEAVQAGQMAQNSQAAAQQTQFQVKQANVQSGQQHLEGHANQQSAAQQAAQENHDTVQNSMNQATEHSKPAGAAGAAKAKTNKKAD